MTAVDLRLDHLAVATRYAANPDQWPVAPRFNPVDRWYQRLEVADDHEVWLLTWLPGQGTDLHDHGGSAGAFHVFAGTLTEDTVSVPAGFPAAEADGLDRLAGRRAGGDTGGPARITARKLGEGAGRRFGTRHIHRITNRSARPAVSIHVYGPALSTMTRYRIGDTGRLEVRTVERAGVQW
ncbi:cysteine dioxygenase [Paractinoplanes rishiriensis]|uniref:Cysteine dioxygenase n=1 Tax=Paractinoplanes rishiriensis TaxID=1050105 RepID=A0A919MSM2_9ACTN|nr:cysteine dioxygenase family protein [Actinoplanes rishiriensis]GIE98346.1 cysteine dioxygenase [Actinoplanes rishiriensis]